MIIIFRVIDGRGTGKTGRLLLLAKQNNGIVVCKNPDAMRVKAERYGIIGLEIWPYQYLLSQNLKGLNLYIDEMEDFVKYCICEGSLSGYSLTKED